MTSRPTEKNKQPNVRDGKENGVGEKKLKSDLRRCSPASFWTILNMKA
jgi:hypothetical protein